MSRRQPIIRFQSAEVKAPLQERQKLKSFLKSRFNLVGVALNELNYVFCSDAYLLEINQQFLHHDTLTDIITFPLNEPGEPIQGEIYISVDRIRDNASIFNTSASQELLRVVFHGALHLLGYKDKTSKEQQVMKQQEDLWLQAYALFHVEQS